MIPKQLSRTELADIAGVLLSVKNGLPLNEKVREVAGNYSEVLYGMAGYLAQVEEKRIAISKHFHTNTMLHPAIRQMSAERVNQTYDRLVEQGKITVGEN